MAKISLPFLESLRIPAALRPVIAYLRNGAEGVSVLGAGFGAGMDIVSATRAERKFLSDVASEYRPEIAELFGLAVEQVTEDHYNLAYENNPVLNQAKHTIHMDGKIRAANTLIATSVGLLAGLSMSSLSRPKQVPGKYTVKQDPANIVGGVASVFGAAAAGRLVRQVLHTRGLDEAIENTAHHQIMQIKDHQQLGVETTPADVLLVQLLLTQQENTAESLDVKKLNDMTPEERMQVLSAKLPQYVDMATHIAECINTDGMRPQKLLSGLERAASTERSQATHTKAEAAATPVAPVPVEASHAREATQEILKRGEPGLPEPAVAEQQAPVAQNDLSHVQRYAPEGARKADFAERTSRPQTEMAAMQR